MIALTLAALLAGLVAGAVGIIWASLIAASECDDRTHKDLDE